MAGNRGPGFLGLVRYDVLLVFTDWQGVVLKKNTHRLFRLISLSKHACSCL